MTDRPLIALEIHDVSIWEPSRVLPIVDTMQRWGYNALVLHQNDLLDACTQLDLTANYGVADLRLKKVRNNAAWLNWLTARLARFDARLFLEIKEPSYHDHVLELMPALLGPDGQPDPMHPSWQQLCRRKTSELLARVPGIGGLIVNLSSPESRVSVPDHIATHGEPPDRGAWLDAMIAAFHDPLAAAGKALFVRDFSYTADMQSEVLAAVDRCDGGVGGVGASVKITAHDYFPEFPENPAARMTTSDVIFEFEAFGEHMGWGVIPNCRVAEFRRRMQGFRDRGARGLLMRISWEAITGANALDSLSAVNVFALPQLVAGDRDARALVLDWLAQAHGVTGATAGTAADLMLQSWQIPAAAYWNGKVFPRHSCLPSSWQEGWLSMATNGMGRRDRALHVDPADPALSDAARHTLFAAKDRACALADTLARRAANLAPDLPPGLAAQFAAFAWLPVFARQFALATRATFHAARAAPGDMAAIPGLHRDLLALADDVADRLAALPDSTPHHARLLFDPAQIRHFAASLPAGASDPSGHP